MKFPLLQINNVSLFTSLLKLTGKLGNYYSPFYNYIPKGSSLNNFTTPLLNFDLEHPVDILVLKAYDGGVNLILNDDKNIPRLINSRFSVVSDNLFKITDHAGFKDTNVYTEETFDADTSLITNPILIPSIEFNGLVDNAGQLPCGSYTFYIKLADADGNESEVVAESGMVLIHIGKTNDPFSIRMGMENESTDKAVQLTVSNISSGFDYVHVYYTRTSSGNDLNPAVTYHLVIFDYPVNLAGECSIMFTGAESIIDISASQLQIDYADLQSVKAQTISKNVLLLGNTKKSEHDWEALKKITWEITTSVDLAANVGSLNNEYKDLVSSDDNNKCCYYNTKNIYYRVGYWPGELYRFGIVYIFNDGGLSPVLNLRGADLSVCEDNTTPSNSTNTLNFDFEPEDCYFDKKTKQNSRGVFRVPKTLEAYRYINSTLTPRPIYFKFDLSDISDKFEEFGIKGFFFVRLKRIPLVLGQGLSILLSTKDYGSLPFIKQSDGLVRYQSFLQDGKLLLETGRYRTTKSLDHFTTQALLVPDAEMQEATYNQLFVSNDYTLESVASTLYMNPYFDQQYTKLVNHFRGDKYTVALTNVPENTKLITNGEDYFSTIAGAAEEAYKTVDVEYAWNKTAPQTLTRSTSLLRGLWGAYVGVGKPEGESTSPLIYGNIYNIYQENYKNEDEAVDLLFTRYMFNNELYYAVSPRQSITDTVLCYRGDCYVSMFTHRMFRNFIDPDTPTNHTIVDPATWAKNYGVRSTAVANASTTPNYKNLESGWVVEDKLDTYANEIVLSFEVYSPNYRLATDDDDSNNDDKDIQTGQTVSLSLNTKTRKGKSCIRSVIPEEQEANSKGLNLKKIFKNTAKWELRGLASLNRSDVNAVGLGSWVTFPICSNWNFAMRDVDFTQPSEETEFNRKRSFYPLAEKDPLVPLRDSNIINGAAKVTTPARFYIELPKVPYTKQEYMTRIYTSGMDNAGTITNELKVVLENSYKDYDKEYGDITKLVSFGNYVYVIFTHGMGRINITAPNENSGQWITAVSIISDTYGSMWADSVIKTDTAIYGVDTVAKAIWRIVNARLEVISDHIVGKFLNDNIDLSEFTITPVIGHINVKTHYNDNKHDVIFTYYNDTKTDTGWEEGKSWSLCYNEILQSFQTFYDWIPVASENIDNIYFSFDKDDVADRSSKLSAYDMSNISAIKYTTLKHSYDAAFINKADAYLIDAPSEFDYTFQSDKKTISFYVKVFSGVVNLYKQNDNLNDPTATIQYGEPVFVRGKWIHLKASAGSRFEVVDPKVTEDGSTNEFTLLVYTKNEFGTYDLETYEYRDEDNRMLLWKHGQGGLYDNQCKIKPTNWYGKPHEFNFEFVVKDNQPLQKIFNNLKIISNKTQPNKFEYEIVGECYDWWPYKSIIQWINKKNEEVPNLNDANYWWKYVLSNKISDIKTKYSDFPDFRYSETDQISKLPYLNIELTDRKGRKDRSYNEQDHWPDKNPDRDIISNEKDYTFNCIETIIKYDDQLNEYRVHDEQLGNDMSKFGRVRGNMQYLEDFWDIEIRPITFKWCYLDDEKLKFKNVETRHRDKYIKVKVRYSGKDLAVILAIQTSFDYSYA